MYKSSTALIHNELNNDVLTPIYKIFENANLVYQEIMQNEFFKSKYIGNIQGRLVKYAIDRQFDPIYLTKNFPFDVRSVEMTFNQKRVELRRGQLLMTISKCTEKNRLPNHSKYKEHYAFNNWGLENQIHMDFVDECCVLKEEPYYGIISFGIKDDSLDFVDLIIPDYKFKNILDVIELKPKFKVHRIEDIENDTDRILSIKNIKKEVFAEDFSLSEGE